MSIKLHTVKAASNSIINYSYLLQKKKERTCIAIDPSWDLDAFKKIISDNNLKLEAILLTHSHFDHTNLVKDLVELYDCSVYISYQEAKFYNFTCKNINYITKEQSLTIGSIKVDVFLTPGHTKGGCTYSINGKVFTGDTLFLEGCGVCTSHGGDADEMYKSLQQLKVKLPGYYKIFPAHRFGKKWALTFDQVMKQNFYLQIDDADTFKQFRNRKNSNHCRTFL